MNTDIEHVVAMSGASGFIGTYLYTMFLKQGWRVITLERQHFQSDTEKLAARMDKADVIVNLAGAPIINRWTKEYKKILWESRIITTRKLVQACAKMVLAPRLFLSASAIGYYSPISKHDEENYTQADDFLGRLTHEWEQEAVKAEQFKARTVIFRFGVVLGKGGGALKKMLPVFKLGLGGQIGNGLQSVSWVHIDDLARAFVLAVQNDSYKGIYNMTAPHPTNNKELTKALGKALGRPAFLRVPEFILRLQFGDGAQVLTKGQFVLPKRLLSQGFRFEFSDIDKAIKNCLKTE